MGIMTDGDGRFRNLEKKLGIFALAAVVGMAVIIGFIGYERDIFVAKVKLYTIADSGKELTVGMPVKLSGFKIGKVRSMKLDDIANVKLELTINKNYMRWIKEDSWAVLVKEGVIGDNIIEISPGSVGMEILEGGSVIPFEREVDFNEIAEEVSNEIKLLFADVKEVLRYINDQEGDIRGTIANVNRLSGDLNGTRERVDRILDDLRSRLNSALSKTGALIDRTNETVGNLDKDIGRRMEEAGSALRGVDAIIGKVDKDYPVLIEEIRQSLVNIRRMTEELGKAVSESSGRIPAVIEKGQDIAAGAGEIIDSVKKTWPISSKIEAGQNKTLKVDSYE